MHTTLRIPSILSLACLIFFVKSKTEN